MICNWRRNFCNVSDISQRLCNCGLGQNFKRVFCACEPCLSWLALETAFSPAIFCDAIARNLKYPGLFVYLFYGFVTEWFLEIRYLPIRAVLGSSQSSQTITTPSAVPAQDSPHHTDQELKQDTSVTALTHCHIASVCPGSALPSWPHWQERFWSTAWLGTPQAENNRTKQRIPLLLWKWVVSHFAVMTNAQPMFRILLPFS